METKPWYQSLCERAILLIPLVALILPMLGKVELATLLTEEQAGIGEWLTVLGTLIASAAAFYGRLRATTKLTS